MRKTLTLALAVALFGVLVAVVVAQVGQDSVPSGTSATTGTSETTGTPETTGTNTEETTTTPTTTVEDNPERVRKHIATGNDISGPCDEAEHANDPRCTGVVPDDHDGRGHRGGDNSGPGSLNSGPGSVNSGGGDDGFDDADSSGSGHSGSGSGHSGGDDSDGGSSGHGGDDSD